MTNVHQIHQNIDPLAEARVDSASDWISKIDRGLSKTEESELKQWLALDDKNIEVFLEVAQLWDKMEDLSRLSDIFPKTEVKQRRNIVTAIAASCLLAVTFLAFQTGTKYLPFGLGDSSIVAMQTNYQTAIGESNTINLPDSSTIVLNTNSFVQIRYTENARIIDLQRGEIHIDVAHDTSRPLSVIAGGKVIQAVGTAFNVEVRNKLVELIVTDGKVLVAPKVENDVDEIEQMINRLPQNSLAISKGEKVDLATSGTALETVEKVDPMDIAANLSWRHGNLIFRGESLADAMAEISRYTDIEFELSDDENLKKVQVAGMFKTGDVTGLLDVLSRNFNINYQRVDEQKILLEYANSGV